MVAWFMIIFGIAISAFYTDLESSEVISGAIAPMASTVLIFIALVKIAVKDFRSGGRYLTNGYDYSSHQHADTR